MHALYSGYKIARYITVGSNAPHNMKYGTRSEWSIGPFLGCKEALVKTTTEKETSES
jgi:hypothetical protein